MKKKQKRTEVAIYQKKKELRDWQQVFTDIEGSVENLEEETE